MALSALGWGDARAARSSPRSRVHMAANGFLSRKHQELEERWKSGLVVALSSELNWTALNVLMMIKQKAAAFYTCFLTIIKFHRHCRQSVQDQKSNSDGRVGCCGRAIVLRDAANSFRRAGRFRERRTRAYSCAVCAAHARPSVWCNDLRLCKPLDCVRSALAFCIATRVLRVSTVRDTHWRLLFSCKKRIAVREIDAFVS